MPAILPHRSPKTIFKRSGGLLCAVHIHPPSHHQYPSLEREGGSLLAQSQVPQPPSQRLPAATSTSLTNTAISPSHRRQGRKKRERRKWRQVSSCSPHGSRIHLSRRRMKRVSALVHVPFYGIIMPTCHVHSMLFIHGPHVQAVHTLHPSI